jgi:hypothetical protein
MASKQDEIFIKKFETDPVLWLLMEQFNPNPGGWGHFQPLNRYNSAMA